MKPLLKSFVFGFFSLVLLGALLGCNKILSNGDVSTAPISNCEGSVCKKLVVNDVELQGKAKTIIQQRCDSCHGSAGAGGISAISDFDKMIQSGFLRPTDPGGSKILSAVLSGRMPPKVAISAEEIGVLQSWVRDGWKWVESDRPPAIKPATNVNSARCQVNPNTGRAIPTYQYDVKPIIDRHCAYCHQTQEPKIVTYQGLKGANTSQSIGAIESLKMPPPAVNDHPSEGELEILRDWARGDFPLDTKSCPPDSLFLPAAPTCSLVAESLSVSLGSSVKLALNISGKIDSGTWDDNKAIGSTTESSSRIVSPIATRKYTVIVAGPGGASSCSAQVSVSAAAVPSCTLTASPASISPSQSSTLTLVTSGVVTSASIDGTNVANAGGTKVVSPTSSKAFIANVQGPGGAASCSVQVNVSALPVPSCTLTAAPASLSAGQSTTLSLSVSGSATSAILDGTSIAATGGTRTVTPTASKVYTATVTGSGGTGTCSVNVGVSASQVAPPVIAAPSCVLNAAPNTVIPGQTTLLTLVSSGNVTSSTLDGTGVAITGGSKQVSPTASKTYSATVMGPGGSNTCSTSVTVGIPPAPTCNLSASNLYLPTGGGMVSFTLTAAGNYSAILLNGTPVSAVPYTVSLSVNSTSSFIATVIGLGGTGTCSQTINVGGVRPSPRNAKLGILVNENRCSFCHLQVLGDWYTTRAGVNYKGTFHNSIESKSTGEVKGKVFAATIYNDKVTELDIGFKAPKIRDGIVEQYRGPQMPIDRTGDGIPDFPLLNFTNIENGVSGSVTATEQFPANVSKVYSGNLILVGTQANPIKVQGDVLVKGDLVIKGYYQGIGTIYATGQIYVPADLKAMRSAFPYPDDRTQALALAQQNITNAKDALGLAAKEMVHLGDIEHIFAERTLIDIGAIVSTPGGSYMNGWDSFKNWYPGGVTAFRNLYEKSKATYNRNGVASARGTIELVEAFLYAGKMVRGLADANSYSIRGGLITEYFAVQSGARDLPDSPSPVHGRSLRWSYWEYDYRMMTGKLPILQYLMEAYPE